MAEELRWRVEGRGKERRGEEERRLEGRRGEGRQEIRMAQLPILFPFPLLAFIFTIILYITPITSATFDFVVRPEFGERPGDLNVTTFAGQTAHLPCTVKHLAGKRVSWIRGRDLQVLSTGRTTFSTDVRISVLPGSSKYKGRGARSVREAGEWREEWKKEDKVWRKKYKRSAARGQECRKKNGKKREFGDTKRRMEGKHEENKRKRQMKKGKSAMRYEMRMMLNSSSDSSPSPPAIITPVLTPPPHTYTPPHLHHNQTQLRKKRRVEWPAFHQHFYHYHDGNTISGLGGSASWYRRELARYKYEATMSRRSRGRSFTDPNPIAIYPQGPLSQDSKGHVPGPNYIEGVWEPEDYTLQIKYTKPEDAGTYICQINTDPRITQAVRLNVVNMRAEIVGSRELYVKAGNPVTLACRVNHGTLMPGFILWYKGDRLVEYDTSGGRISVTTESTGVSHLLLRDATPADSANYTCSPSAGAPASLTLNVIVDERQAAMQQGNAASPHSSPPHLLPPTLTLLWGASGGAWQRLGGVGVLLVVGAALSLSSFPFFPLLPLIHFLFFLFVLCVLLSVQKRGRFK